MELTHPPSVFELIGCDGLKNGLREALRYLLNHIYQLESVKRLPIPRPDESVLLIDILIEYNHLKTYHASYAENLYNLIRVTRSNGTETQSNLYSLICLTIGPYLKRKCDKYIEDLNYKETRTAEELKRIRLYRIFSRSCSFLNLICLVRFAAGKSAYHNILDGLLNIKLMNRLHEQPSTVDLNSTFADRTSKTIADILGHGLTIGSYIIQFLDYWNTHSNSSPLFSASLPIPEPPKKDELAYTDDKSSSICLICLHVRQNECVLSNTGYVFCYSCIQRYVTVKQRCPVTGHPTTLDNIVKIHTSSFLDS